MTGTESVTGTETALGIREAAGGQSLAAVGGTNQTGANGPEAPLARVAVVPGRRKICREIVM